MEKMRVERGRDWTVYLGDCLEILPTLEAESVDAVITDPPYHREFLHLWEPLSYQSERLLRPGGFLFTLAGCNSFDIVLSRLTQYLTFYWIGSALGSTGMCSRYHPRQILTSWKPFVILCKGKVKKHPYIMDAWRSKYSKLYHPWEQPVGWFTYFIDHLTTPEYLILDPFMGSGTTLVAATTLGRKSVGIEIDENYFNIAVKRLREAEMQLRLPLD